MKRHGFAGQGASHGNQAAHRRVGGIGACATPARVFKGKRMAGRLGNVRCTVRNIDLVRVDVENNLLLIRGSVPGPNGSMVIIRETNRLPVPVEKKE